ncbi:LIM and calponin homology domains-containing protein 1-like [Aulostomus maculatus]
MASQAAGRDVPNAPRDEQESLEPNHPEPACQEAQKWIEAVTGKSFGDKDFRSALENGILLCELLSAIKPGLVKKINRLPTPIAGLDNLSVFLRGCEELGLKGSQLFDPGDLQDTSIRANLKDSDCSRKLKNVLNTVFWLGKAASGCASYSGPTLNLKEFEGLLAQMRVESEEGGDSSQKRSVRDSGYDCWDSERSESLSPPRHTRDNSLDSLDSFGSRSQHSPSPDVVNRGNSDGRGSDSEADAPGRKPDVRKDDMLARRTASSESRSSIPFNQFLPNRSNASSYILSTRRKPHAEEGEQRSPPMVEEKEARSPSPNIILRRDNDFLNAQKSVWDSSSDGEGEAEKQKVPDVCKDDLASRRAQRGPVTSNVHQFVPPPVCSNKDRERWEGIRRASQQTLQEREIREEEEDEEEEEAKVKAIPNKQKDDLARRRAQSRPRPHRDGPMSFVSASMSQADKQKWEKLRMTEPSRVVFEIETKESALCGSHSPSSKRAQPTQLGWSSYWIEKACLEKNYGSPFSGSAKAGGGHSKVVTFGGVTEIGQPIDTVTSREGEETELLRCLLSKATVAMPTIGLGSQLSEREHSQIDGEKSSQTTPNSADLSPWTTEGSLSPAELDARFAQYERRAEEEDEDEEEERIPDLQKDDMMCAEVINKLSVVCVLKNSLHEREYDDEDGYDENEPLPDLEKDDMMARRTGSFQKTSAAFNQFLPVPGSVKYSISPVSAMKQLSSRPKLTEQMTRESSIVTVAPKPEAPPSKAPPRKNEGLEEDCGMQKEGMAIPQAPVTDVTVPLSSPSITPLCKPPTAQACKQDAQLEKQIVKERVEEKVEERKSHVTNQPGKKPFWLEDDALPPMMMSRRVAFMSEDTESVSMSDMVNEDEVGHLPLLSQSRYERMHEQYNNVQDEEDQWQNDLARWKNRRRCASQELIKKEEERKRIEKRMKEEGSDSNKRKSIKTYKKIVEEKERREAELCEAYRNAATPEEAAMVLQRYALRFTISDATLDYLKLPRSTSKPRPDLIQKEKEQKPVQDVEPLVPLHKPESTTTSDQKLTESEDIELEEAASQETSVAPLLSSPTSKSLLHSVTHLENTPPQSPEIHEPQPTESQNTPKQPDPQPRNNHTPPQTAHVQPHAIKPVHTLPSPPSAPSRPVPLLAAKPYCQPRNSHAVKVDGLVRVNGEATEDLSASTPPASPLHSPEAKKAIPPRLMEDDVTSKQTTSSQEVLEQPPPPQTEKSTSSSGSAISSLFSGRNCITTTTIVTELTQTYVEPHPLDFQSNGQVNGTTGGFENPAKEEKAQPAASPNSMQEYSPTVTEGLEESSVTIETPMLNLAKRVNHWVWDPNEERKRLERWQQEQERLLQEQYQKEQEKLKKEWEKAQLEVEEEERKHNEEERKILEETVTPLSPSGHVNYQQLIQEGTTLPAPENNQPDVQNVSLQQNGQRISQGNEDQHASKLHFLQDSACDGEPSKKQELWKTASLDRNPQLNQAHVVKRSGSHDVVTSTQQSSSSSPQPPSPSRCVSGKRLCSGCSEPLGKGAAMIIDTLGLFFHIQCFKCGVCEGQLGDATAGTDVRIRNGLLSCHDCYIASRGRGQPTTL